MILVNLKKYEWLNLVDVVHAIADNTCKARFPEKSDMYRVSLFGA